MSSADTTTTTTTEAEAPEVDEVREAQLAELTAELGDAVVGSLVARGDLTVRVATEAWAEAGRITRRKLRYGYFGFLSAIDWRPSPFGRYEDADVDNPIHERLGLPWDLETGIAGGETRFQVFARVEDVIGHRGITLKVDVPDDTLTVGTWRDNYAGADWHERETHEMFGIDFAGHPDLRHLYLPGDFEGFPLRKDYPLLARVVKPWPGIVDVEPMPGEVETEGEGEGGPAVEGGSAVVPDAADAPAAGDLAPAEPPASAPTPAGGDADPKPAVGAPVPAHGEVASQDQLDEGDRAVEEAGGGGVDTTGQPTGEADTGRPGQGGTGQDAEGGDQ